ncbi:hypothetical protein [Streptomyces atroolivaceus]|uniref:hypothetical protein n=1 Tax=Streptomyces atroolivaceus TaxID=66869 RepID=UPI0032AFDACF
MRPPVAIGCEAATLDRFVEVGGFYEVVPGDPLGGLGERAVGDQHTVPADADCPGLGDRLEGHPLDTDAAIVPLLDPRLRALFGRLPGGIGGDEQHVLHGRSPSERFTRTTKGLNRIRQSGEDFVDDSSLSVLAAEPAGG